MGMRVPGKVFINGRFLCQSTTGVQRYAIEAVLALDGLLDGGSVDPSRLTFTVLAPRDATQSLALKHIEFQKVGRFRGHLWEQLELPAYARSGILLNLGNAAPIVTRSQIVTIHDASVFAMPKAYSFAFRNWYKMLLWGLGRRAVKVMTDSGFSREELIRYCRMPASKIHVNYLGGEHIAKVAADYAVLERNGIRNGTFVLAVGSFGKRKNLQAIIDAVGYMGDRDCECVVVGARNERVFGGSQVGRGRRVKYLGYVTDAELRALYGSAACLVYPSFYEGFGLPPVEAMACGCPVIAARTGSLPEVCGSAALYCDPHDPKDIAARIEKVLGDPVVRADLCEKGRRRVQELTWRGCAQGIIAVVDELLGSAPAGSVSVHGARAM